ncbi:MAG TPA: glycosyltransferase family 4 protein [Anaerolineae bacterium]|nr:glycosyltransferase family 4 protein [Anaerolineae bacterium]HOR00219.1 glycosyltransferase family 4 protein [Anaerolineae bacterium]HPL28266.1 glycosyltransferase family 4 protein [Anaerolineae bacterium]
MRVAFVPGSFRPDRCGVSHYTARLMAELEGRGAACLVLTTEAAAAHHARRDVVAGTRGWGPSMLATVPAAVRRLAPDILHIQHAGGSFGFRRAVFALIPTLRAVGWRRPVVVTIHEYGWWEWWPPLVGRLWRRLGPWGEARGLWDREDLWLLTGADAIIVTHEGAARVLAERLPRVAPRVARVPIGSNIPVLACSAETARRDLRLRFGWPPEAPVIVYFGFVHPVKGLETLLRAFRRVVDAEPRARLLLSGGTQSLALHSDDAERYSKKLKALLRELGLDDAVRLTGYQPEAIISQHLAGADLGVLPFNDGVTAKSGSLLAMWAHGLPVVATRPAVVPPELERAAWLVPGRNAEALAASLLQLLGDAGARQVLAARSREAAAGFDWPSIAERHLAIYRRLLEQHGQ